MEKDQFLIMETVPKLLLNFTGHAGDLGYVVVNTHIKPGNASMVPNQRHFNSPQNIGEILSEELTNNISANGSLSNVTDNVPGQSPLISIILVSLLFCIVGIVGIVGNTSIILIIATDRKMRRSVTNLYISNLAVADLLVMLFGIPEIVQFIMNRGWLLGEVMCKVDRCVLVLSLYTSVFTQVAVCVER